MKAPRLATTTAVCATLATRSDAWGGVHIISGELPASADVFAPRLARSLEQWQQEGRRTAWLNLPAAHAGLYPAALAAGFSLHHCEGDRLVLVRRLAAAAMIPDAATHGIGVGGVVLAEDGRLLVVREWQAPGGAPGQFKLPGGMLGAGEHLMDGIVREVREETGIPARCEGLVSLRHHHRGQFGSSNIYAVFRLAALARAIIPDPAEIAEARWMEVAEFLSHPGTGPYNRHVVRLATSEAPRTSVKLGEYLDGPDSYEIF